MAKLTTHNCLVTMLAAAGQATPETLASACGCKPEAVQATLGSNAEPVPGRDGYLQCTPSGERLAENLEDRQDNSGGHGYYTA